VARVARIEREAGYAFARIVCRPAAGIDRHGHVLVLTAAKPPAPPPPEEEAKLVKGKRKKLSSEAPKPAASAVGSVTPAQPATANPVPPSAAQAALPANRP
jgi:rod shape-determining protein MreC